MDVPGISLVVLAIAVVAVAGGVVGRKLSVPYPTFLVALGVCLGFLPVVPQFRISPEAVFLVVLPPLVFSAGFFAAPRELSAQKLPIGMLAVGLTVTTTAAVAFAAHQLLGLPLATAFVLGAAVSPTDPVAAVTVMDRAEVRSELSVIIEGEGLVNDGVALVLYALAVDAATASHLTAGHVAGAVLLGVPGGVAVGLLAAFVVDHVVRIVNDPPAEIAISLLTPFVAYLPAASVGASGVLAALTAGLYLGWRLPTTAAPRVRLQGRAFWDTLVLLLNLALFALVGLSFPAVLDAAPSPRVHLLGAAAGVCGAVVALRILWMLAVPWAFRLVRGRPSRSLRERLALGWSGMRGGISLAAALAIPPAIDRTDRAAIVFVTFTVIIVTLVLQGGSLPWLLERLGLDGDDVAEPERTARLTLVLRAMRHIAALEREGRVTPAAADQLRAQFRARRQDVAAAAPRGEDRSAAECRRELVGVQRDALLDLRDRGDISAATFRAIQRDLDLEATWLD